jgi:hypothetical protein
MKLRSHSGMNDCQAQGSSRFLALYGRNRCLRPTLHRNLLIVPFAPLQ